MSAQSSAPKRPSRSSRYSHLNTNNSSQSRFDPPSATPSGQLDLSLQDVTPEFNTWSIKQLAQYRKALKLPTVRPLVSVSKTVDIDHIQLGSTATTRVPLVSIRTSDPVSQYQVDMRESVTKHFHSAAPLPLLSGDTSTMVHPRSEAETILYFLYTARFNRFRKLRFPLVDAAGMVREVREGKFCPSFGGATCSSSSLRYTRNFASGLSGTAPYNLGARPSKRII